MPAQHRAPRQRRGRLTGAVRLLALACVLQLTAGLVSASVLTDRPAPAAPTSIMTRSRPVPAPAAAPAPASADRAQAVDRLLRARSSALLARDRAAFLATVDPAADGLRARQAALFDALEQVPLKSWSYQLDPRTASAPDVRLDRRYGAGRWWAPQVVLDWSLEGFDPRPVPVDQHLTFVQRDGTWLLGADDDFALLGRDTPRLLWDRGPVVAEHAPEVLVLGRPGQEGLLRELAELTAAAVPRVTGAWGPWSERVVLLVPSSAEELSALLGGTDVTQIAAYATAELRGGADDYDPTGDRVLINPDVFARLGPLGRRVVLTHEVAHIATRRASGPALPVWLAEGLADHLGYLDVDLPLSITARDLAREIRAGRTPAALPTDRDFDGSSERLTQAYQGSWLAVRLLVEQHGLPAVLRLYRTIGAQRGVSSEVALESALREQLGTTTERFTADWRAALERHLR